MDTRQEPKPKQTPNIIPFKYSLTAGAIAGAMIAAILTGIMTFEIAIMGLLLALLNIGVWLILHIWPNFCKDQ